MTKKKITSGLASRTPTTRVDRPYKAHAVPDTSLTGETFGCWVVLKDLDKQGTAGGMSRVYHVRKNGVLQDGALKVPKSITYYDRFVREANILRGVQSQHVPALLADHVSESPPYIVCELLRDDLSKRLENWASLQSDKRISLSIDVAIQLLEGLEALHANGYIHRDIKPANICFRDEIGKNVPTVVLIDYGIARDLRHDLTEQGNGLGTPAYQAPEQVRAANKADGRADIWAAGIVLCQMLTGKRPDPDSVIQAATQARGFLEELAVPRRLTAAVVKCLQQAPEGRWQTAKALRIELEAIQAEATATRSVATDASEDEAIQNGATAHSLPSEPVLADVLSGPVATDATEDEVVEFLKSVGQPHQGCLETVKTIAVVSGADFGAHASEDGAVEVWRIEDLQNQTVYRGSVAEAHATALLFAPKHGFVLGDAEGRIWGIKLPHRSLHNDSVTALAYNSEYIVSSSLDGTIGLCNCCEHRAIELGLGRASVRAVSVGRARGVCIVDAHRLVLVDLDKGRVLGAPTKCEGVEHVVIAPHERWAISGSYDGRVCVWRLQPDECSEAPLSCSEVFLGHTGAVRAVAVTPDGRLAVTSSDDGTLRVWDPFTRSCVNLRPASANVFPGPLAVAADCDGGYKVIFGCDDGAVRAWRFER